MPMPLLILQLLLPVTIIALQQIMLPMPPILPRMQIEHTGSASLFQKKVVLCLYSISYATYPGLVLRVHLSLVQEVEVSMRFTCYELHNAWHTPVSLSWLCPSKILLWCTLPYHMPLICLTYDKTDCGTGTQCNNMSIDGRVNHALDSVLVTGTWDGQHAKWGISGCFVEILGNQTLLQGDDLCASMYSE